MFRILQIIILLIAHLLLAGLLLGALFQQVEAQRYNLAWLGVGLALLLIFWIGALLMQRLWQRKWAVAGALALLLVANGLALCVGILLMGVIGVTPDVLLDCHQANQIKRAPFVNLF